MTGNADQEVRDFYEQLRYPGPDALVTTVWARRLRPYVGDGPLRFIDAGCGSGRHTAGLLRTYPQARGTAFDVSGPSLAEARALVEAMGFQDRIAFLRASFLEPLPFDAEFDLALAAGTIHHSTDPTAALCNIAAVVKPGGMVAGMVYSRRSATRRYEVKEMLQILAKGDSAQLRPLYRAHAARYETPWDRTPRQMFTGLRKAASRLRHRLTGRIQDYGYFRHSTKPEEFFIDAFANPLDQAFDTWELKAMFDAAGLELERMFTLGRADTRLLPRAWRDRWAKLDTWEQVRLSELADPAPAAFSFLARKR